MDGRPPGSTNGAERRRPAPHPERPLDEWSRPARTAVVDRSVGPPAGDNDDGDGNEDEKTTGDVLRAVVEWVAVIVGAFVVALLIKAYLFQPFFIPSGSMEPTLQIDDRVLVNKLSYDLHEVNRGDIIVFERPENLDEGEIHDLIKRVIGLANDTLESTADGRVLINGHLLEEPYLTSNVLTTGIGHLPGCINPPEETTKCTVPPGHVFVLGDNRNNSTDSRVFGPISEDLIVGRAFLRVWPITTIEFL